MCDRLQTPNNPAHMPGGIREAKDFGDTVAIDLFSLADCFGQVQSFLNIVDLASAFQIVVTIASKHPNHVYEKSSIIGSVGLDPRIDWSATTVESLNASCLKNLSRWAQP